MPQKPLITFYTVYKAYRYVLPIVLVIEQNLIDNSESIKYASEMVSEFCTAIPVLEKAFVKPKDGEIMEKDPVPQAILDLSQKQCALVSEQLKTEKERQLTEKKKQRFFDTAAALVEKQSALLDAQDPQEKDISFQNQNKSHRHI